MSESVKWLQYIKENCSDLKSVIKLFVNIRIQSKNRKIQSRNNSVFGHAVHEQYTKFIYAGVPELKT